ncbi:hypothetical protein RND71_038015 [Anisodus tanguticus]|uniref:Piwi domain-containing protein n=1 Tax=Anisodus tanguticus TaxID=243964 RepID=A0AAE1QZX1_9SOLA|nr:hypothetical protein RND71_038015 [Anisodus tanguticus]
MDSPPFEDYFDLASGSENSSSTSTLYYDCQVTSSPPTSGFATNSGSFHKVIEMEVLKDNKVDKNEIELSLQTSPLVVYSKMGFGTHVQQVFDEMPTREVSDSFDKLSRVSENLIDTGQLEMMRVIDIELKSKVVNVPEVPLDEGSSKEIELLKGVKYHVLETQLELVVHPPNSDDLDWESESVDNAYSRNIDVNDHVSSSVLLEDLQAQNTHATNGITGRVVDSIINSRRVYSLLKLVREELLLLHSNLVAYALGGDTFRREANISLLYSAKQLKKKCCSTHENHMCLEGNKKTNLNSQVEKIRMLEVEDIKENKAVVFKEIKKSAIVKILPLVQEFPSDGTPTIMVFQPLSSPYVSLHALKKLNVLLIDMIDNFSSCEFYCSYKGIIVAGENCLDMLCVSYAKLEAYDAIGRQETNSLLLVRKKSYNWGNSMRSHSIQAYLGFQKHYNEFEAAVNELINMEHNDQIIEACKIRDRKWNPKFVVIVVVIVAQKNHHTKLFHPNDPSNVPPGTIIHNKVCHPRNYDFYLCAHVEMIGTTHPTQYHVLFDELGFSADDFQELVHNLSYVY